MRNSYEKESRNVENNRIREGLTLRYVPIIIYVCDL